jgi:hypothetical protein
MVCDRCEAECPESKQAGQTIRKGQDAAIAAVKLAPGWTEVATLTPGRRRRMTWDIELLCPECTAIANKAEDTGRATG